VQQIGHALRYVLVYLLLLALISCAKTVDRDKVYGTYTASFPLGTDTITLNQDGSFNQRVAIVNEQPVTVKGSWTFDSDKSRVDLVGSLIILDGFDKLKSDWRSVSPGIVSLDVEQHWLKIHMRSASQYPYIKQ
jgi:hypothetical protein